MVIDLNNTYKMMMMMMIRMMKTQKGHNSANFEAMTSRFCMPEDLDSTLWMVYLVMMMMMIIKLMKMRIVNHTLLFLKNIIFALLML